jgi:hypothetical protein
MVKRKSTKILEALTQEDVPLETPAEEKPEEKTIEQPTPAPIVTPAPLPIEPPSAPKKKMRMEKDPLAEEIKKLRKMQEDQENRLEHRLEGLIARKFMEVKSMARPVSQYKPKMHAPIQRLKVSEQYKRKPMYEEEEEEEDYSHYMTQEESEEEEVKQPQRSILYSKIFG